MKIWHVSKLKFAQENITINVYLLIKTIVNIMLNQYFKGKKNVKFINLNKMQVIMKKQ